MAQTGFAALFFALSFAASGAQTAPEPLVVFTEHPRLFLRPHRLRLLQRERERASARWQQLETLVRGGAQLPEQGFALALYHRVSGDAAAGRNAVKWALGRDADLRQIALVFDWCQDSLSPEQSNQLIGRLRAGISPAAAPQDTTSARARALAAIALWDHTPDVPARALEAIARGWWRSRAVPALRAGKDVIRREDLYAFMEILHAIRDNTNEDLREDFAAYFKELPVERLLMYYPAAYAATENDYRIPVSVRGGAPDLRAATLARAADLALVAYESNAVESQMLQGWLMHDRFAMRGALGAPYEFLWGNPYQPGLSYFHAPLVRHDPLFGRLFVRSTWEESARWFGAFDGVTQLFDAGAVSALDPRVAAPVPLDAATIVFGRAADSRVELQEGERAFAVGLKPGVVYELSIDGQRAAEVKADSGGIAPLDLAPGRKLVVRITAPQAAPAAPRQ